MKPDTRETEVLPFIDEGMGDASYEEKLKVTHEFWEFFDAINDVAGRIAIERLAKEDIERDKSAKSASVDEKGV